MSNRIVSLDAFRGLLLLSMTLNHLVLYPFISIDALHDILKYYVYSSFGYLSNSEGFFFLAGIVSGIVYGKLVLKGKEDEVWPRVKKRILQMYFVHVALLLAFALFLALSLDFVANWKQLHNLNWVWVGQPGINYFLDHPWEGFFMGMAFLYSPPFFDILPIYMLFLALTPFVIRVLHQGRSRLVMGMSAASWLISQYIPPDSMEGFLKAYLPVKLGWFHPLAVQLLFMGGLTLGFLYIKGALKDMSRVFLTVAIFLATMFLFLRSTGVDMSSPNCLGFLRLAMFALKASIAFLIARFFHIKTLALLGKFSLQVFAFHVFLVYALVFFLSEITCLPMEVRLISLALSLASLWIYPFYLEKIKAIGLTILLKN